MCNLLDADTRITKVGCYMSKKLKEAVRFLERTYKDDEFALQNMWAAEDEQDYRTIIAYLDKLIDHATYLKDHLVNEVFDPNAR